MTETTAGDAWAPVREQIADEGLDAWVRRALASGVLLVPETLTREESRALTAAFRQAQRAGDGAVVEAFAAQLAPFVTKARRPRRRTTDPVPPALPQQTFPEAKAVAVGLADGPKLRRWLPVEGQIALAHRADKDARLQLKLVGHPLLDWLGLPATVEALREELRRAGLPSVMLLHTLLGAALERIETNRVYVSVALDDLITAIGWKPHSAQVRETMRGRVWRWVALYDACQVIGCRPGTYRDPDTREVIDLGSRDALIRVVGQRPAAQLAFDDSAPPLEVTYVTGPWIEQWRGKKYILMYFGDVRKLAAIPAGKPSGAWAQSAGLALQQLWRERTAHAGEPGRAALGAFTRRELLDLFPPEPTAQDVLGGREPGLAKDYWRMAVALLKHQGLVGTYREPPAPSQRQGWQAAWLDQPLTITPPPEARDDLAEIAARAQAVRERARQRRRRLPASAGGAQ